MGTTTALAEVARGTQEEQLMDFTVGDTFAIEYLQGDQRTKQMIEKEIKKLPHRPLRVMAVVLVSVIIILLVGLNWTLYTLSLEMKIDWTPCILIDLFGIAGIVRAIMAYQVSRPSVYGLLAGFKARHPNHPALR